MTYEEALLFLKSAEEYGSVLGLANMRTLLSELGNPQDRLKFIHIAGTNGKGSTAAYISGILAEAGYLVGRYISPVVFDDKEKIQITGKKNLIYGEKAQTTVAHRQNQEEWTCNASSSVITKFIDNEEITTGIQLIQDVCQQMTASGLPHPTIFEIETALSFLYFLKKKCDIVVLEVGLGGRLDATNVISTTVCSVITSISMDHMHILGDTLEKIAYEKAGIIKNGVPVVSYDQEQDAFKVIEKVCRENHASLKIADFTKIKILSQSLLETVFIYDDGGIKDEFCEQKHSEGIVKESASFSGESEEKLKEISLHEQKNQVYSIKLLGENQVKNAAVAILTAITLNELDYRISLEHLQQGLIHTIWRGRFELVKNNPTLIIDGAHNEDAAISLAKNIKMYFPGKRIFYIMGVLADKDYAAVLKHTAPLAEKIFTITPDNPRALSSHKLSEAARKYCKEVVDAETVKNALESAYKMTNEKDIIIAFGSLSYLKEIYDELGINVPEDR